MANELRGEVELTLRGKKYVLKPSIEAIMEIESLDDDASVPMMFISAVKQKLSLRSMAFVVCGCINVNRLPGQKLSYKAVAQDIRDDGMNQFMVPVTRLLRRMITPAEAEEEAKKSESSSEESQPDSTSSQDLTGSSQS